MSIYITQIEKHKFICGLFWQSLSRPRELAKEAAGLARKIDFDLMVLRKDQTTAQAGFAQTRDGARRRLFSLAAAVSSTVAREGAYYDGQKQRVHNWLGAFKLPDGKWAYFAVRDANFLPNGDFAGTKEQVIERLQSDYGLGGWNAVIGDAELEEYGFHNFNVKRIQDLLPQTRGGQIKAHAWWGLRQVGTRVRRTPLLIGALAVLLIVVGAYTWQQHQKNKEQVERERALEAVRLKLQGGAAQSALPRPWTGKPGPAATAQACIERLTQIAPGGWRLDEYSCTPSQVSYAWSRQNSTIEFLLEQVPGAVVEISGDRAIYTEQLTLAAGESESLLPRKALLEPVLSRLQSMSLSPKLTAAANPAPLQGASAVQQNSKQIEPEWQTFKFSMDMGGYSPTDVAEVLNRPGIRIDKLTYRGGAWSIEGVIYAN